MKKLLYISILLIMLGCKDEVFDPESSFTKIYDNNRGSEGYYPIDIVASPGGYVILAGVENENSDFLGTKIIHIDTEGNFVKEDDLSSTVVAPLGEMISIDSVTYFVGMDPISFIAMLVTVSDTSSVVTTPLSQITHPLAVNSISNGNLVVLSYDVDDQLTVFSEFTVAGDIPNGQSVGYTIGAGSDIEANILNHYTDPERSGLPFFCGEWSTGQYYFNGVYNYNLSLVFSNFGDAPNGVVQGQSGFNGGFSSLLPLQGSDFALFGFQFNDNFAVPVATLNTSGTTSTVNYLESSISEFKARTTAKIIRWQSDVNYTIIAAETQSQKIALYFYETTTGSLVGIHKLGYINPYELSSLMFDADGGLMILGTTYVADRFKRVFLSKIPEDELRSIIN
ncbi:MAG: hypothetical protein RIC35_06745 [Marinoscillum sp.]